MTREERIEKLRYLITCMKCEVSGKCCDDNCPTQYAAGNMGEIIENLEEIAKALEQEPKTGHWIRMKAYEKWGCSECNTVFRFTFKQHSYCPNCGAKMEDKE